MARAMPGDSRRDRRMRPTTWKDDAGTSAASTSVNATEPFRARRRKGFFMPACAGRTPGSVDRVDPQARGLPEGTSRRQRRRQPTAGREEGARQPVYSASAGAMASSTRCKRAALRELCWFDSNPMHQSMVSVVQSARTPECESGGRGFESRPSPQSNATSSVAGSVPRPPFFPGGWAPGPAGSRKVFALIAQLDRVPDYESGGSRFDSS
jgi:hypothetical protein